MRGVFKMNVIYVVLKISENNNVSSNYLIESLNLYPGRLEYVNYDTIQRSINLNLIPISNRSQT